MEKEQILSDLKDLIGSLYQGENLKDKRILKLWEEKKDKVFEAILKSDDLLWISEEYLRWLDKEFKDKEKNKS